MGQERYLAPKKLSKSLIMGLKSNALYDERSIESDVRYSLITCIYNICVLNKVTTSVLNC